MEYWKNPEECVTAVKTMWEEVGKDAELREGARKVNQLILFDDTEYGPGCAVWVDCRNGA